MPRLFLFAVLLCGLIEMPSAAAQTTNIKLSSFDEVNVTGNVEVTLAVGDEEAAALYVEGIPEDKVSIKVSGGVLKIKVLESLFYKNEDIKVYVTYRQLRAVRGDAGAYIENKSTIEGDELLVRSGSGARVDLVVALNSLDGGASEGGALFLAGETGRQEASAATGGKYEAFDLESSETYANANTGGEVRVVATELLEAKANTGGKIVYKGNPEDRSIKTVFSGKVEQY